MLTMNEDDETVLSAIRAGASGYLLKGSGADEVLNAVRAAAAGGMVFGAALAARVATYFARARPPAPEVERALPRPDRPRARGTGAARLRQAPTTRSPRELYVSDKTVRNTGQLDLHQAARRGSGRGDRQGPRGRVREGLTPGPGRTSYESSRPWLDSYDVAGRPQASEPSASADPAIAADPGRVRRIPYGGPLMRRVRSLAADQGGVVSRRQLYAHGSARAGW